MSIRLAVRWLCIFCAVCVVGCGKSYEVVPVEGVVLLDGKPLAGVSVYFSPDVGFKEKSPPVSRGSTDAQGHFQMICDDGEPGAVVGKHLVTVIRHRVRPEPGQPKPPEGPPIPPKYSAALDSPLKFEVKREQKVYDIKLNSGKS